MKKDFAHKKGEVIINNNKVISNKNLFDMIVIANKRSKQENLLKKYGTDAVIIDVTSKAQDDMVRLSPFYPHGGIPVPFSPGCTAMSVEGIWQGLKVFETCGVDLAMFRNATMKNIKRTVRRFGRPLGHQKGVRATELLSYLDARLLIYVPAYKWMLENKAQEQVQKLRSLSENRVVVLLDYNTNEDIADPSTPLSHAAMVKAYIEGKL